MDNAKKPPLTICVSMFNEEAYLERCLTYLKNQTYQDFTVLMVDNASTDRTVEVATAFAKTDSRFSVRASNKFKPEAPAAHLAVLVVAPVLFP